MRIFFVQSGWSRHRRSGGRLQNLFFTALLLVTVLIFGFESGGSEDGLVSAIVDSVDPESGYLRFGQVKTGELGDSVSIETGFILMPGHCYMITGMSESEQVFMDLAVTVEGKSIAETSDPGGNPALVLCPSEMKSSRVILKCSRGCGEVHRAALAVFRRELRTPPSADADMSTEQRLDILSATLGNAKPRGKALKGTLSKGENANLQIPLDAGRCYWFAAVGGSGVRDMDLKLTVSGREVGRSEGDRGWPVVFWCTSSDTRALAHVKMYEGKGEYLLAVFESRGREPGSRLLIGGAERDFLANRLRQAHLLRMKDYRPLNHPWRGNLNKGEEVSVRLKVNRKKCVSVLAVADSTAREIHVEILSNGGRVLGSGGMKQGIVNVKADRCPLSPGRYFIRLKMAEGRGQYILQAFSE